MLTIRKKNENTYLLFKGWRCIGIGPSVARFVQDLLEYSKLNGKTIHVDLGE